MHTSSSAANHQGLERELGKADSLLHSIRKPAAAATKPWKKPIAGPPPTRVYVVEPHGFRQLVQKLTGATHHLPLHNRPPVPPTLHSTPSPPPPPPRPSQQQLGQYSQEMETSPHQLQLFLSSETMKNSNGANSMPETTQLTFPPAPNPYYSWSSSYPLLSPGAVSMLEHSSTIL